MFPVYPKPFLIDEFSQPFACFDFRFKFCCFISWTKERRASFIIRFIDRAGLKVCFCWNADYWDQPALLFLLSLFTFVLPQHVLCGCACQYELSFFLSIWHVDPFPQTASVPNLLFCRLSSPTIIQLYSLIIVIYCVYVRSFPPPLRISKISVSWRTVWKTWNLLVDHTKIFDIKKASFLYSIGSIWCLRTKFNANFLLIEETVEF